MLHPSQFARDKVPQSVTGRSKPTGSAFKDHEPSGPFLLTEWTVCESACFEGLHVLVCALPAYAHLLTVEPSFETYHFPYRPRPAQGEARLTIPALGVTGRLTRRDDLLLIPPHVRVQAEWRNATGRIATFFLTPGFLKAVADQMAFPVLARPSFVSLSIDQSLDVLCRLLMEETEAQGPRGPLYFEALARALTAGLLCRLRGRRDPASPRECGITSGIGCAIQHLENGFRERLSVAELACRASLSVDHFIRTFAKVTGSTPHQYVLRIRLSHARQLMTQRSPVMSLGEVAVACGFSDQAHFGRHFRRVFGLTPAAFLQAQARVKGLVKPSHRENVLNRAKTFYTGLDTAG